MTPTSQPRGIFLMLLSVLFFTVNTLAVRSVALTFSGCDGWKVTLFRGIAGSAVVITLYSRSGHLRLKSLLDRPKVIASEHGSFSMKLLASSNSPASPLP